MMFYNGFNLLIDLILCGITYVLAYRAAWFRGYSEGQQDYREWSENFEQYVAEQAREAAD